VPKFQPKGAEKGVKIQVGPAEETEVVKEEAPVKREIDEEEYNKYATDCSGPKSKSFMD
jgi:hypothetical protein